MAKLTPFQQEAANQVVDMSGQKVDQVIKHLGKQHLGKSITTALNNTWPEAQTIMPVAIPVIRGCGTRQENGVYVECGVLPGGQLSIEDLLVDPPVLVDPQRGFPLPPQGMGMLLDPNGTWHLTDRVGLVYYPHPADILEEGRRYGFSRRVQKNLYVRLNKAGLPVPSSKDGKGVSGFDLLTPESRLFLVHDRGYLLNWADYNSPENAWVCPQNNPQHHPATPQIGPCAGLHWENLPWKEVPPSDEFLQMINTGEILWDTQKEVGSLHAIRVFGKSFASGQSRYPARLRPLEVKPIYGGPAIIARLPITRIAVVNGDLAMQHFHGLLGKCKLPTALVSK